MKIIEKLGINDYDKGVNVVASNSGVGKTSMLIRMACDFVLDGKNVLYLNDEDTIQNLIRKCNVNVYDSTLIFNSVITLDSIEKSFLKHEFDVIIIDSTDKLVEFGFLRDLSRKYDAIIIVSKQTNPKISDDVFPINSRIFQGSDMVISLTKKPLFTRWENIKYFLCFWLKKPNRNIKIVKSRYGRKGSFDVKYDFENNTIK